MPGPRPSPSVGWPVLLVLLAALGAGACGEASEPEAVAAAVQAPASENDGPLTLYSGRSAELMTPLLERFERESGITLDVRWGESGALADALMAEGTATPADLFLSDRATPLGQLSRKGLLRELPAELVRGVPSHFAGNAVRQDWVGLSGRARTILHDPAAVPRELLPRGLRELGDPRHRARFGLAPGHPSFRAQLASYRVLHGEEALDELLARIHANEPRLYGSEDDLARAVAGGEVAWGLVDHVLGAGAEGAEARLARHFFPGEGAGFVDVAGLGVLSNDPRALELVRFLLADGAQDHFAERAGEYPLARRTPPSPDLPALAALGTPRVDFADVAAVLGETERAMQRHGLGG